MTHATTDAITVALNGAPLDVPRGTTLAALLALAQQPPDAVATAVDGVFVARSARDAFVLAHGAQVTCLKAIVGG